MKSYSDDRLQATIDENLNCLERILQYNINHDLLFFRISSDIIPFASHPVCKLNWQKIYKARLKKIGSIIIDNDMRISMHPDQFTLINALDSEIITRSKRELLYHTEFLDLLGLDRSAKVQIHVGGAYGNKEESIKRFIKNYASVEEKIKARLTIENDDRLFTVDNCLQIHHETGLPVLFDSFHHTILNNSESIYDALKRCSRTWKKRDGLPMVDYSSQNKSGRPGNHTQHIDSRDFKSFLSQIKEIDCDIMLEIKDKEKSALKAIQIIKQL